MLLNRREILALPPAWACWSALSPSLRADEPQTGIYVAVGYGGRRLYSLDGVNWEIAADWRINGGDDRDNLISVVFGNGKFVAVGGGVTDKNGLGGRILTSADGKTWQEHPGRSFRVHPVLFGEGRFVAGGPDYRLLWSTDGETWETGGKISHEAATHFRMGAFGNDRFVFAGNGRQDDREISWAVVSKDGTTIDAERSDLPPSLTGMVFGGRRFVIVGRGGLRTSSTDGQKWEHEYREPGINLESVVWTGKRFFTAGEGKGFVSTDGIFWKDWSARVPCSVLYVDEERGIWIGSSWPGHMWSSADGRTWNRAKEMTPNGINAVAYSQV